MKEYNYKIDRKKEKGITLVALVITAVVMLILAGVAIAAVVDGDGLFSRARESAGVYENVAREEGATIQSMINQIDGYIDEINNPAVKDVATIGTIVTENQTYDGRLNGTYDNPIIPKGFAPINESGADWGTVDGYQKGLVITDKVDGDGNSIGNEFVWVPVDGVTVKFERVEWGTGYYEKDECEENVPTEITESVTTNGGFYIARYEAGLPDGESSTSVATNGSVRPVSKRGATVWDDIAWNYDGINDDANPGDGAVTVARSMYPEEEADYGVVSTLIYGTQWDTALEFIGAYGGDTEYAMNSTGKGNYSETINDQISGVGNCGADEAFRQKNIYDMAGNIYEWTMEKYSTVRVDRGGGYENSGLDRPASFRGSDNVAYDSIHRRFPCSTIYKVN